MQGMAVDLARALAARVGVALDVVEYPRPGAVFDGAQTDAWDVTFLVVDPQRTAEADVSPAYMQSEFTYLVPAGSTIRDVADADRPGTRIGVPRGDAVDLSLSRILKQATLVRAESQAAGIDLLRAGRVDAYAAPRSGAALRCRRKCLARMSWPMPLPRHPGQHLCPKVMTGDSPTSLTLSNMPRRTAWWRN